MIRRWILLLLLCWLPLQGLAASAMPGYSGLHGVYRQASINADSHHQQHQVDQHSGPQTQDHQPSPLQGGCSDCDSCQLCHVPALPLAVAEVPHGASRSILNRHGIADFASHIPCPLVEPPRINLL